jgi:steroid Delta-isomerase
MIGDRAEAYVRLWETMSEASLRQLPSLVTPDVHFADPFNDVRGIEALNRVMAKALRDLAELHFVVTHRAWHRDLCLMRWDFAARTHGGRTLQIAGMSELIFAGDKVAQHIDHWDAGRQFYELLPAIGTVLRLVRRHVAA